MLAIDENKNILEWMSTDEQHHVLVARDDFGREITVFLFNVAEETGKRK